MFLMLENIDELEKGEKSNFFVFFGNRNQWSHITGNQTL